MKCIYCGAKLQEGSLYCSNCGKETQIVADIDAFEDDYLTGILERGQQNPKSQANGEQKTSVERNNRKKQEALRREQQRKKQQQMKITFGVIFAILLVVAVIAGIFMKKSIDEQRANSFDYQVQMAEKSYANGQIRESIAYYERAIALEPDNISVRLTLAEIYLNRKDFDSALILYLQTLDLDPNNLECYRNLISIYEQKNKTDEILALAKQVTDEDVLALFSDYIVHPPVFSNVGGKFENYMQITLSSEDDNKIYYTLDGTDPIVYGKLYKEPISLESNGEYSIRAVCVNDKKIYSEVIKEEYTINIAAPSMPEGMPNGGNFEEETEVSVYVPENCTAYYTWDGTIPNITSDRYIENMLVPEGNNILSVIIVDNKTGKWSEVYRGRFVYYPSAEAAMAGALNEEGENLETDLPDSFDE